MPHPTSSSRFPTSLAASQVAGRELNERQEREHRFDVSACHPTEMLEVPKHPFPQISLLVQHLVIVPENRPIRSQWDHHQSSGLLNHPDNLVRIVALVGENGLDVQALQQCLGLRTIVSFPLQSR